MKWLIRNWSSILAVICFGWFMAAVAFYRNPAPEPAVVVADYLVCLMLPDGRDTTFTMSMDHYKQYLQADTAFFDEDGRLVFWKLMELPELTNRELEVLIDSLQHDMMEVRRILKHYWGKEAE